MSGIVINGKTTKSITINGKNVKWLDVGTKRYTFAKPFNVFTGTFNNQTDADAYVSATTIAHDRFTNTNVISLEFWITTFIGYQAFFNSYKLQSIIIHGNPAVEYSAFSGNNNRATTTFIANELTNVPKWLIYYAPLTHIELRSLNVVGEEPFFSVVNAATTNVWLPIRFNNDADKNKLFGVGHWNNITFHWVYNVSNPNIYTGYFDNADMENDYKGSVVWGQTGTYKNQQNLTSIRSVIATSIINEAFFNSKIVTAELPGVTTIGDQSFGGTGANTMTTLIANSATHIGQLSFYYHPLTHIELRNLNTCGAQPFYMHVDAPTTTVILPSKFNNDADKNKMFGVGRWSNITFTWV